MQVDLVVDTKGLACPMPIVKAKKLWTVLQLVKSWKYNQRTKVLSMTFRHGSNKPNTSLLNMKKKMVSISSL